MSMTNENEDAEWQLGDAITIRQLPEEPEADEDAAEDSTTPDS